MLTRTEEQSPTKVHRVGDRSLPGVRRPRAQRRWSGSRLRPFSAGMLGVFGQVQVHALTSVGSTGLVGAALCWTATWPSIPGMGPNGVPGSRRPCIWSRCACSSSTVSKAGAPSRAWRGRWNGGRISGRSDRATIGIGSPSLRCEIGRCGRPRAPRRNLGTRGLANLGARAAQNPEPRHQVAVTRLDVHHTMGGSPAER